MKPRILFVDDEPSVLKGLEMMLFRQRKRWQMLFASSGREGLLVLEQQPVDVVVADMRMPGMDGLAFLAQVQENHPDTVRFMLTGNTDLETAIGAVNEVHVFRFLTKPCAPDQLIDSLEAGLAQHHLLAQQALHRDPIERDMLEALKHIHSLPPLSAVYVQVQAVLHHDNTSTADLAQVIETDPSITAKLLRLANAVHFGFQREVTSVKDAVSLMGLKNVERVVSEVATFEALGRIEESPHFNRTAFWTHAIGCAAIAKVVAAKVDLDPNQAFVAGLLHDIGKVVLDGYFPDAFARALQEAAQQEVSIFEAEQALLSVTHETVGRLLAERWNLPPHLIEVIGTHHSLSPKVPEHTALVQLIHVADAQCRQLQIGRAGDDQTWAPCATALESLALSQEQLNHWIPEMKREIEQSLGILTLV